MNVLDNMLHIQSQKLLTATLNDWSSPKQFRLGSGVVFMPKIEWGNLICNFEQEN